MKATLKTSVQLALTLLILISCSSPEEAMEAKVRAIIKQGTGVIDPDSVQFRHLRKSEFGDYYCGELNAKNTLGGYAGWQSFYLSTGAEPFLYVRGGIKFADGPPSKELDKAFWSLGEIYCK